MSSVHGLLQFIGTHSLIVSIVGQCFVLYQAVRAKDAGVIRQSVMLILGLLLVVVGIELRPKSPPNALADGLGVLAALVFVVPVAESFKKTRRQRKDKGG